MAASLVGQRLGKYEITELLGQGGMATVYKGYQREIDRYAAIKVLPPHPGQNSQFVERFRLEARTIARLQHPHILPLYDYGDENGVLYLVMAFVDGGSLSERIRKGALPVADSQRFFQQIASALDYAHRQNVIHRDIKPDNILLDREGHALLSDFGIVKIMEEAGGANLTGTGGLVGTPAYMSPEQAQGLPIDRRTDIYSLGIVVYEMLCGKQPYSAETPMQLVLKHITEPVPSLCQLANELPLQLDAVMEQALAKNPNKRYDTASEFYEDFNRVLKGEAPLAPSVTLNLSAPPPGTAAATRLPAGTVQIKSQPTMLAQPVWNPLILLGGFAIIALLVVAVVVIILNFNREQPIAAPTSPPVIVLPTAAVNTVPTFGRVSYTSANSLGDTVNVQVSGLAQPAVDKTYTIWLYNTGTQASLKLGSVRIDAVGDGQLSYTDSSGAILPTLYNAILCTEESTDAETPSDKVDYSGSVPFDIMEALSEILITSPDGLSELAAATPADATEQPTSEVTEPSSLIAGALAEADIGVKHAGLAAAANSEASLHTHAEHTINILHGTYVDYNNNGRGDNPGRGYGINYFTDRIQNKLDTIVSASTRNPLLQNQVELIRVCILNTHTWMQQVTDLETQFLTVSDPTTIQPQLAQSTQYAGAIVDGIDLNQNGRVDPFEGECGLQQITAFAISVGNVDIFAGSLPQGE